MPHPHHMPSRGQNHRFQVFGGFRACSVLCVSPYTQLPTHNYLGRLTCGYVLCSGLCVFRVLNIFFYTYIYKGRRLT